MRPSLGRIVHVRLWRMGAPRLINGSDVHPAIVTAVHGSGVRPLINARVIADSEITPPWETSIPHEDEVPDGYPGSVWFWPPRQEG